MRKVLRLTSNKELLKKESKFKESAKKIWNIEIDFLYYLDLYYYKWFRFISNWEELKDYDIYWIWGRKALSLLQWFIYKYGILENKKIIDTKKKYMLSDDKFSQLLYLEKYNFNIPKSLFLFVSEISKIERYIEIIKEAKFWFPIIWKYIDLDRWEWVFLIKSEEELLNFLLKNIWKWILFQEFIENKWDYRVIVVWDKVIWAIKRYNKEDFKNNVSTWWKAIVTKISKQIEELSIKIAKWFQCEIAWIDFFIENNNYIVIEINRLPQYDGFEKATWISYSDIVLQYFNNMDW